MVAGALTTVLVLSLAIGERRQQYRSQWQEGRAAVRSFGLSDLALSTEARYTRHPAISDPLVPFMNMPGSFEHFPSGSFFASPLK